MIRPIALVALLLQVPVQCLVGQKPTCGTERWAVKTMTDAARDSVDIVPIPTTIDSLRRLIPGDVRHVRGRIAPTEYHTYVVRAQVIGWKAEADRDLHLVLAAPGDITKTMIAEIPNIACAGTDRPTVYAGMLNARATVLRHLGKPTAAFRRLRTPTYATVAGVGFFDYAHGQTGLAPNAIELHPVLAITFEGR